MKRINSFFSCVTEHFPVMRWCFSVIVIAFSAVVSIYKYIDMSEMTAFSSPEAMFLLLTDVTNIVFIYLPLYLFIVSGIMFDTGFGEIGVIRFGSRKRWLFSKLITYILNTLIFFGIIILINFTVSSQVFNFSDVWSGNFVGFRVMMGQPASDFADKPLPVIITASAAVFMLYMFCGTVNMFISLLTSRESAGLFISLIFGILLGLLNMLIISGGLSSQLIRIAVLFVSAVIMYLLSLPVLKRKDFGGKKMY